MGVATLRLVQSGVARLSDCWDAEGDLCGDALALSLSRGSGRELLAWREMYRSG